jgi:hypothetical protein
MEHTDFSKILQTFLPIVIFVLWAMFSNAGKKRKMRNFPAPRQHKPDPEPGHAIEQVKTTYHQAPKEERESPLKTVPDASSGSKAASTGRLPQHQPAIKISLPADLHMQTSSAAGASGPQPVRDNGGYSPGELQKFVIWSEILSKPVGLRAPE